MPYPDSTYEQQWREARSGEPVMPGHSSHTPGPWDVDDDTMEIFSVQPGHSIGWVAKVLGNDDNGRPLSSAEMAANARLIAAAPELLAALKLAVSLLKYAATDGGIRGDNADEWWGIESQCDAAIAKTEGRE